MPDQIFSSPDKKDNSNNVSFVESIFVGEQIGKSFPQHNYRLRIAGLTEFDPYISEAPQFEDETNENYNARLLTSGRYFGEQQIILDDVVHSEQNIQGLEINSQFLDGKIPRTLLFLDKCVLDDDGDYIVTSKNLNDLGCVTHGNPSITFPVDGLSQNKGYLIYRKTSTVHKHDGGSNGALVSLNSGWNQVTGFSSSDLVNSLGDQSQELNNRIKAAGFVDGHTQLNDSEGNQVYKGYESLDNELFTEYKILNSGDFLNTDGSYKKASKSDELTSRRTIDLKVDPAQSYSLERKVTRKSNTESNPVEWETIQHDVSFPFNDDEDLSDYINTNVIFNVDGVYEVVGPVGDNSSSKDYFEVDFAEDWGKSEKAQDGELKEIQNPISNRVKTDYLSFEKGESIKVNQKNTLRDLSQGGTPIYEQFNSVDIAFSPFSTGKNGFLTGDGNDKNFYELEYQFVPAAGLSKKLYYETGENLSVGQEIFYNTGQENGIYNPVASNFFGETPDLIFDEAASLNTSDVSVIGGEDPNDKAKTLDIGPSYLINNNKVVNPEVVPESISSGVGYSYFNEGEKYIICPKGGYNTIDSVSNLEYNSAGETYKAFFQGEQQDDLEAEYALTEYKTFDDNPSTEETFYARKNRDIRIGESAICIGDSCSELEDKFIIPSPPYLLDNEYKTDFTLTNGSLLNIDGTDGSIKISNLKNNKQQFSKRSNLFFEKNYVASLTVMANGEKQDISALKQFIKDDQVYYLERDIYIDSNTASQANFSGPIFSSSDPSQSIKPFTIDALTPNPDSLGEEKLYVTQTYHSEDLTYPFNDYDYFNSQPSICEKFIYSNDAKNVIDNFKIVNKSSDKAYRPGDFTSAIVNTESIEAGKGYSILLYRGTKITPTAATASTVTYTYGSGTKISNGYYYELQYSDDGYTWVTISNAHQATSNSSITIDKTKTSVVLAHYRILEWIPSPILTSYGDSRVVSESADSLILKTASSKFYDISKKYHSINNNGSLPTSAESWGGGNVEAINIVNDEDKYLSINTTNPYRRSFNILKGDFSFEFWVKGVSNPGAIIEKAGDFKIYMHSSTTLKVDFNGKNVITYENFYTTSWQHVAITKTGRVNKDRNIEYFLELYIEGDKKVSVGCNYEDYTSGSPTDLHIGKSTLTAKLYQPRIYIGKSLYTKNFTASKTQFTEEPNIRRYKVLKYDYRRVKSAGSDWIINRNSFDNASVPSDYILPNQEEDALTTKHGYEWLNGNPDNPSTNREYRARTKYFNNYAFRAPNNPHINKNYEGTPVTKAFDVNPDNYAFYVGENDVSEPFITNAAPYYYEYLGNSKIEDIRLNKKGGEDTKDIELSSQGSNSSFSNASRLRVTKYVYRLYTKDALVVADTGFKSSRSSQEGWTYQLQYKLSGGDWADLEANSSYEDYLLFYQDEVSNSAKPEGNIDHASVLPMLVLKTDITKKHKPESIEFRVQKKQIISIPSSSSDTEVFKKYNFLPLEINIPTKNTLLDITKKAQNDTDSAQEAYTEIDTNLHQAVVHLDESQTYIINKSANEKILTTSDINSELKVNEISINDTFSSTEAGSTETSTTLENDKPYEISNLTGIRIYNDGSNIAQKSDISSVVGVKPSGLDLTRFEKHEGNVDRGESGSYDASQTKIFFTPSVTGSHFEELQEFQQYTANDSSEDSLFSFGCDSFVTGNSEVTVSTGVSGVSWRPVHDFYNNPYITGSYTINADDEGKTFLISGSEVDLTFKGEDYSFEVANIGANNITAGGQTFTKEKISTVNIAKITKAATQPSSSNISTVIPSVSNSTQTENTQGDFVLVDGLSKLDVSTISQNTTIINTSSEDCYIDSNYTLGSMSGVSHNSNGSRKNNVDSGVIVMDHEEITLTPNDASQTIFVDTNSKVLLPSGFSNAQDVTLVNSTDRQLEVVSESGFLIASAASNYIPKRSARKFSCSKSNNPDLGAASWSAQDMEILSFNQLSVTSSDDKKVFIHNEDVDVRINSSSISNGFFFTVARSQIEKIDFTPEFINQQKTRLIRIFVDGVLEYVSKPGEVALNVTKQSYGWSFDKVPVLNSDSLIVNSQSNGKVYIAKNEADSVDIKFDALSVYTADFQVFVIGSSNIESFTLYPTSTDDSLKFYQEGVGIIDEFTSDLSRSTAIRIHRGDSSVGKETGRFIFETIQQSSIEKITQSAKDQVVINYNKSTSFELPVLNSNFNQNSNFKLNIINSSDGTPSILYPKQALSSDINSEVDEQRPIEGLEVKSIEPFSFSSCSFVRDEDVDNPYQKFLAEEGEDLERLNTINNKDVVLFDGSVPNLDVKKFLGESLGDKYTSDTHRQQRISALGGNKFSLHNHGFKDKQKITFDLASLTVVDHYFETNSWDPDSFNGTIKSDTTISQGESLLVFNTTTSTFFIYIDDGVDSGNRQLLDSSFSIAEMHNSVMEEHGQGYRFQIADKAFVYINKTGGNGTASIVSQGSVFDLSGGRLSTKTAQSAGTSIAANLVLTGEESTQSLFIKSVNENEFQLYTDEGLSTQVTSTTNGTYRFFSEYFHVEDTQSKSAYLINLSNSSIQPKDFTSQDNIGSALPSNKYNEYNLNNKEVYSATDSTASGIYIVDGYNSSDTTDITALDSSQILITGNFYAQAALTNNDFDNHYFVNGGLDNVTIKNTNDSSTDSLAKNRAYKHTSNGTFTTQDLNDSSNRDVIYYPKDEIHILDRSNLGLTKQTNPLEYNFVFYRYEEGQYNEDEKIVLPDTWSNLSKVAIVNVSDAPISVVNFSGTKSATLNAKQALFMTAADFTGNTFASLDYNEEDYVFSASGYTFSDQTRYFDVKKGSNEESFIVSFTGEIILDFDTHDAKTILIERDTSFLRPYLFNSSGIYTFDHDDFTFSFINISSSAINELTTELTCYSGYTYTSVVSAVEEQDEYDYGYCLFNSIEAIADRQLEFEFSQAAPNSDKKYHVFGKRLDLKLKFRYRNISENEAEELSYDTNEETAFSNYYFLEGIVEQEIRKINIINTAFENVLISSVSVVGANGTDTIDKLNNEISQYFAEETLDEDTKFLSSYNSESQLVELLDEASVTKVFLAKNKVLNISTKDLVSVNNNPSVFDSNLNPIDGYESEQLLSVGFSDVKYIKRRKSILELTISEDGNHLYAFPYVLDAYIPPALDLEFDQHFTIVNSSRSSINIISSDGKNLDGSSSTLAIGAGSGKKIKYTKSSNTFSDVSSELEVSTVGNSISNVSGGVFTASIANSASSPLLLNKSLGKIKIINNTGSILYLKNSNLSKTIAGSATYQVAKDCYVDLIVKGDNFLVSNSNADISFTKLSSGALISSSIYKDKAVIFDAEIIDKISFDSASFFSTTMVPFIKVLDFKDSEPTEYRTESYKVNYTIKNKSGSVRRKQSFKPIAVNSGGFSNVNEPICHLNEFLLDSSVNNKILLTNRYYDYVFKNNAAASLSLHLYNRNDNTAKLTGYSMRRLSELGDAFASDNYLAGPTDENDDITEPVSTKIAIKAVQNAGANDPVITEQETYNDIYIDNTLRKKLYLNKSFYSGKIIVMKEAYDIMYDTNSSVNLAYVNLSNLDCNVYRNKISKKSEDDFDSQIKVNTTIVKKTDVHTISKPLHSFTSSGTYVITQPADIKVSNTETINLINASKDNINVTVGDKIKKLYFGEKAEYTSADIVVYRKCPGYNRKDWFLKLFDADIAHLERDQDYFNQAEFDAQNRTRKKVMVDFVKTMYRFSNFFQTNLYKPEKYANGYESISTYNQFYKFGVSIYGDKKNQKVDVNYDIDPIDYITSGLKLSWDMPKKVIAYAMNTGHERLCYCKEFDQRNNSATYSGIEAGRAYILEDFDDTELNFVSSAIRADSGKKYPEYKYSNTKNKEFTPEVTYNGDTYGPGQKFVGVVGKSDYQLKHPNFGILKAGQFIVEQDFISEEKDVAKEELQELNKSILKDTKDPTSGVQYPIWTAIGSGDHKEGFVNAVVDKVYSSGDTVELLSGRKLKDIQGSYNNNKNNNYFEFEIPKHKDVTSYSSTYSDVAEMTEGKDPDKFVFRVNFGKGIDYPGYEYEIKSSLGFENNFKTDNNQTKSIVRLSVSEKDSLPFVADGTVGSLNLNFSSDSDEKAKIQGSAYGGSFSKRLSLQEGNRSVTLKNNIGYSFIPFSQYQNEVYGFSLVSEKSKVQNRGIRLRLKKLARREIRFEDLKDDIKIGEYLNNNSDEANLSYNFETEVNSISYHDIKKPGGVLVNECNWTLLSGVSNNVITTTGIQVNDGDAIGLIKSGSLDDVEVYFARVISKSDSNEAPTTFKLLRIFSKDTSIDASNVIAAGNGDYIRVLNYLDLTTVEDGTHRQVKSSLTTHYNTEQELTSLTCPVLISNQMFFLEAARTELNNKREDSWGNFVYKENTVRANFELSTVAKYWFGETSRGESWQSVAEGLFNIPYSVDEETESSKHWVNEEIFSSNKNLLFRSTTQLERTGYTGDEYNYNVKLNKNIKYRYIIKSSDYIQSIGGGLTGGGEFYNTNEDFKIIIKGLETEDERRKHIYENICIIESTDYVDACPYKSNKYEPDNALYSENVGHSEYMDYQLPVLNRQGVDDNIFKNVDPFYLTENFDSLFSYDSKSENLTLSASTDELRPISGTDFSAGLFYDLGMPAICKYIYGVYRNKNTLDFSITDFWDGFLHDFGGPNTLFKVQPIAISYDIESYDGSNWSTVESGGDPLTEKIYSISTSSEISKDIKYRIKINSVRIQYKNPSSEEEGADPLVFRDIDYLRLPFKWRSKIKDTDLGNSTDSFYTLNLIENHLISKSVSIPEDGVSKFGEFNYLRNGEPYTRLYIFNFEHRLRANYKDPINRNSISKVIITDKGNHYRTPPTVAIAAPDEKEGRQATARAIIEGGKLKFIEVVNSGSGYIDLNTEKQVAKRIEQSKKTGVPYITQTTAIGAKNASNINKSLDYDGNVSAAFNLQRGLRTVDVTLTSNESSLPVEEQEEFGLTFDDTEVIAQSIQADAAAISNSRAKVNFMKGSSEDDETWSDIQQQAERIQGISNFVNETINDLKESQSYDSVEYQESQEIAGTEDANIYGLYKEDNTDKSKNAFVSNSITFDIDGNVNGVVQFETHPAVENGTAVAVVNNSSIAEYRVINNRIASKTTPWMSSFSREQNPNLPQSFGLLPTAGITSEVFNSYARAVNFLSKIRVEAPIFAKVRRYRQVEWRYISSPVIAGLTFPNEPNIVDSGLPESTYNDGKLMLSSLTYDNQSKVNYIEYMDPEDFKYKKAYFSHFTGDEAGKTKDGRVVDKENISTVDLWDEDNEQLSGEGEKRFKIQPHDDDPSIDSLDEPKDVAFPNIVNIPEKVGVHCNPASYYIEMGSANYVADKSKGLTLPNPVNKRAWAYGGDIIDYATSAKTDVSSDTNPFNLDNFHQGIKLISTQGELTNEQFEPITTDLVDIKGADYIKAGYQNEIVFGCQANGKPFNSAFLRTTKVWTEYEVVANPDFTDTLPEDIKHKYKPEESKLRCTLTAKTVNCENSKIGKVKNNSYHNICNDGKAGGQIIHSYESEFGLVEGDDVIGPKQLINQSSQIVQSSAKATFQVEPEFNLALAVYISNKQISDIVSVGGTDAKLGPCMHHCMPGELKTLSLSEDPLIFDLKK